VVTALADAGISPSERWDESRGTALYWVKGHPALKRPTWTNGVAVFRGTRDGRHGWGSIPLDVAGDPDLGALAWLPIAPWAAPDLVARHLLDVFAGDTDEPI